MSDITPTPSNAVAKLTVEEVAARVNATVNAAAGLPDGMTVTKHLSTAFAVHYDDSGKMDIPETVMQIEIVRAVANLEGRVVALEQALRDAKIPLPKAPQTKD